MRALLFIPLTIALVCGVGFAVGAMIGWSAYPKEMSLAAATCLIAGMLAVVPLIIVRRMNTETPANVAQAALVSTMIHLFVCIGVAAVVLLTKMRLAPAFTYWLLAFYWLTLFALAAGLVAEVRCAAARSAGRPQNQ